MTTAKATATTPTECTAAPPDEQACRSAVQDYLVRAADAPGESARSRLLATLIQQLCDARLEFIETLVPDADCFVRVRGKDRALLGPPGQAFGSAILVFQDDLGRAGRAEEARQQLRYLACLWSLEPSGQRRHYLCLATDGYRLEVSTPMAPEPGRPTIVPGEIALKRLTLMDLRTAGPADLCAWLDRGLCRRRPLAATPANLLADFGAASHAWNLASPELSRLWARLAERPDCQAALDAWLAATAESIAYGDQARRFVLHAYLALVARLILLARLNPAATPGSPATALPVLDGSAIAAMGVYGLLNWPLLSWTALPEAGDTASRVAITLAGLMPAYTTGGSPAAALDALCAATCDNAYRRAVTSPAWLAPRVAARLFGDDPRTTLADPACGHGGFLRAAADLRRTGGADPAGVLDGLAGLERDPLAATVAQVGLLLSSGELATRPPAPLTVPVRWAAAPAEAVHQKVRHDAGEPAALLVAGRQVAIPAVIAADQRLCHRCLLALWPLLVEDAGRPTPPTESEVGAYLWLHHPSLAREPGLRADLLVLAGTLHASGLPVRGAAGLFDLLAALPALYWRGRFDAAVARPGPRAEGVVAAAWELVREGGSVACVLPRAAMGGDAHERLRRGELSGAGRRAHLRWWEVWDAEEIAPPEGGPLCVFFGERLAAGNASAGGSGAEVPGSVLSAAAGTDVEERPVRFTLAQQRSGTAWSTESVRQPELGL